MNKQHHIIMIPGLKDQNIFQRYALNFVAASWRRFDVYTHPYSPHWEDGDTFEHKLAGITELIDDLSDQGHIVSLFGLSAGGSAVLNAFCQNRTRINAVVNATGRVREGKNVKPTLDVASKNSPAFRQSVLLFEKVNEPSLTPADRKRIMTIRPLWDEIVPSATVPVPGATNVIIPVREHLWAGVYTSTIYASKVIDFIKK